jgi:hypothetical protein
MSEAVVERAEVLVYAAGVYCDEATLLQDARAICLDSLFLKVRAQEFAARVRCTGPAILTTP